MGNDQQKKRKIVQIASAERGWILRSPLIGGDGKQFLESGGRPAYRSDEVACWALLDDGECVPMVSSEWGSLYSPHLDDMVGHECDLMSPVDGWIYETTKGDKPKDYDWELAGFASDSDSERAIWRRPY